MRDCFVRVLCDFAKNDPGIILITGDLGYSVLDEFRTSYPKQFINAGVAEQNMMLVACGMALEGYKVFVYSIANFPTLRCLEMIRNDVAYHNANVKIVSIGAGFSYGALGISHHATEDLAIMRSIPDVKCYSPSSLYEVEECVHSMCNTIGPCYLRLDRDKCQYEEREESFVPGRPRLIRSGEDVALFATGGILSEVIQAATGLQMRGISASVYSVHSFRPVEPSTFARVARSHRLVVSIEEHSTVGGLAGLMLECFAREGYNPYKFLRVGLDECFSSTVGSQKYLRGVYGMDSVSICSRVEKVFRTM